MKTENDIQRLKELRQILTGASSIAARGSDDAETKKLLDEVEKTLDTLRSKLFDAE